MVFCSHFFFHNLVATAAIYFCLFRQFFLSFFRAERKEENSNVNCSSVYCRLFLDALFVTFSFARNFGSLFFFCTISFYWAESCHLRTLCFFFCSGPFQTPLSRLWARTRTRRRSPTLQSARIPTSSPPLTRTASYRFGFERIISLQTLVH